MSYTITADFSRQWHHMINGTGSYRPLRGGLVRCKKCGGMRLDYEGPHSTQVSPAGRFDCVGDAIETGGGSPR